MYFTTYVYVNQPIFPFFNESWTTRHRVNTEFRTQTTSVKPQKPGHHKITTKPHPPFRTWQKEMLSYTLAQLVSHTTANYVVGTTTARLRLGLRECFVSPWWRSTINTPNTSIPRFPTTVHHMPACRTIHFIFRKDCATLQLKISTKNVGNI